MSLAEQALATGPGLAYSGSPEVCALSSESTTQQLEREIKLQLLLNEYLFVPGGHLFDSPAFWELLSTGRDIEKLLLSQDFHTASDDTGGSLVVSKNGDAASTNADALLTNWIRSPERTTRPSAVAVRWTSHIDAVDAEARITTLRDGFGVISLPEYAAQLGLSLLKTCESQIRELFRQAKSFETPSSRHALFRQRTKEWLRTTASLDTMSVRMLRERAKNTGEEFSRGALKKVPEIFADKALWEVLVRLRESAYFLDAVRIAHLPSRSEHDLDTSALAKWFWASTGNEKRWVLALDQLMPSHVQELRRDSGVQQAIRRLSIAKFNPNTTAEAFIEDVKLWGGAIEAAAAKFPKRELLFIKVGGDEAVKELVKMLPKTLGIGVSLGAASGVAVTAAAAASGAAVMTAALAGAIPITLMLALCGVAHFAAIAKSKEEKSVGVLVSAILNSAQNLR